MLASDRRSSTVHCRGMTLLEVLVAMAVFSILSMMAYGGLQAVLNADQATKEQAQRLSRLQRALSMFGDDLEQIVSRPIRDAYGEGRPTLDGQTDAYLEWTRAGWQNPAGHLRSTLQRVAYAVEDGKLTRSVWYVLDRAQDTQPQKAELLDGVTGFSYRMLDDNREWQDGWPSVREEASLTTLPRAIELMLDTERWGTIRRLLVLPAA